MRIFSGMLETHVSSSFHLNVMLLQCQPSALDILHCLSLVYLKCSNDGTEFGGSIYQKVCEDLDTSVNLAWTSGTNCTRFGIAAKYQLDPTASISAKVNNSSLIGVGYTQTLRPGVKLTLSALVDGKSINAGGHKLGLALELEA
ncbi:voltage dependent anion channel 2 [Phyllostomus discolor]|uniref:Non-selective voltage-gated ion channel VDAC2 n=1 Tax=Phyllostomus discolor TaxID=89673 RepID=A0A834AH15_9CHIR|nr:voltage dependent anion channel 2 [Phyllostomus discolor]